MSSFEFDRRFGGAHFSDWNRAIFSITGAEFSISDLDGREKQVAIHILQPQLVGDQSFQITGCPHLPAMSLDLVCMFR